MSFLEKVSCLVGMGEVLMGRLMVCILALLLVSPALAEPIKFAFAGTITTEADGAPAIGWPEIAVGETFTAEFTIDNTTVSEHPGRYLQPQPFRFSLQNYEVLGTISSSGNSASRVLIQPEQQLYVFAAQQGTDVGPHHGGGAGILISFGFPEGTFSGTEFFVPDWNKANFNVFGWVSHLGNVRGSVTSWPQQVPEPPAWLLVLVGLGLAAFRLRWRKASACPPNTHPADFDFS